MELASLRTARARDEGEAEKKARAARAELEAERQHSRWDSHKNSCLKYPDIIIANSRNLKQKLRQAHSEAADGTIVMPPPQSTRQRMAFEEAEEAKTGTRRKKELVSAYLLIKIRLFINCSAVSTCERETMTDPDPEAEAAPGGGRPGGASDYRSAMEVYEKGSWSSGSGILKEFALDRAKARLGRGSYFTARLRPN